MHLWVNQAWGWPSIHAPVLAQLSEGKLDAASIAGLKAMLMEGHYALPAMEPLNDSARHAVPP
jgi:hypothetical protein